MKIIFTLVTLLPILAYSQSSPVYDNLNINNINARFYSAGMMFLDTVTSTSDFEFMQGSNQSTIFAANLWVGGKDPNGQLHIAGQMYGSGKDFYPGPVSDPQYYPGTHSDWNFVWKVAKQDIDDFTTWFNCTQDLNCTPDPNYVIPNSILDWPAHGDPAKGQDFFIAPFYDYDNNGFYDPTEGDRPCIKGDVALYTVFNDDYLHGETGGDSLRMEIRVMHYAYNSTDSALANTIFSEYTLLNYSNQIYTDMYVGVWEDMDIGCSEDDYVGCDVERNLGYMINGDAVDDAGCNGALMFGTQPPAQGVVILKGPKQNNDQMANGIGINFNESINGCGYGDAIVDNERLGLGKFVYFDQTLPGNIFGDPSTAIDYYSYLNGYWKDGTQITYGGNGNGGIQVANYCFPDDSDTNYYSGTGGNIASPWSEWSVGNTLGDRRFLMSMGKFDFVPFVPTNPATKQEFTIAHITARDYVGGNNFSSLNLLKNYTDVVINFYACDSMGLFATCINEITLLGVDKNQIVNKVNASPNPTNGIVNFESSQQIEKIEVFSISGKKLISNLTRNSKSIDLTNLPKGVYLIHLLFENELRVVKKVVKN